MNNKNKHDTKNQIKSPINILPHQSAHVEKIWDCLIKTGELAYIDTSRTGLGKTHVALEIAYRLQKLYGFRVGIIAPNQQSLHNDDGWLFWAEQYGIVIEKATTYASIRGKGAIMSDDWLVKNDKENKKTAYHASDKFNAIAAAGIFLIFDEFHMATRESSTHYACAALVRACTRNSSRCRIGLISLTPGDKTEHWPQIVRLTGLIRDVTLVKNQPFTRNYMWKEHGLGEMINACVARGANENTLKAELLKLSVSRAKVLIGEMYKQYIRKRICFAMPVPQTDNKVTTRNLFLECTKGDIDNLNSAISRLCDGVSWNGYTVAEKKDWNLGQINVALKLIERYKLRTLARYISQEVKKNPDKKIIVSMGARCTEHFEMLSGMLGSMGVTVPIGTEILLNKGRSDPNNLLSKLPVDVFNKIMNMAYKPKAGIMNGTTSIKDRVKMMRLFQCESDPSWCLLISPGVGDKSISLHDTHGNHPREILIFPDFYHARLVQTSGRIDRVGLKSDAQISIVYCKEARLESSVLKAMINKSKIAKEMLSEDQEHLFPGKYPVYVENDKNNVVLNDIAAQIVF